MTKKPGNSTRENEEVEENFDPKENVESSESDRVAIELGKSRELTVSTLFHLMGLPSQQQLGVIEAKLDSLSNKLTALSSRIDRMSKYMSTSSNEQYLDRIDFQLADLRTMIKKVFPRVAAMEGLNMDSSEHPAHRGQMSLTSEPPDSEES